MDVEAGTMKPMVSVIIPCRNEAQCVDRCLNSVLASEYPPDRLEVIVADGMSHDGTREQIDRHAARDRRVRRIENPGRTTPGALNRAIAAANGNLILRLDARAEIAPDYIARAVHHIESSGADCVGGAMRTLASGPGVFATPIQVALSSVFGVGNARYRVSSDAHPSVDTVFGACWRREVFQRIGGFDQRLDRSQDIEFSTRLRRAGGTILMSPDMKINYYARHTLGAFCRQNWINGIWAILPFAHIARPVVRWRHLAPLALVLSLAVSISAGAWTHIRWLECSVAASYLAANFTASVRAAGKNRSMALLFLMPVTFASLHLTYGAGSAWGCGRALMLLAKPGLQQNTTPEAA
jgi:glycosyltransferase involved in cell wall biosynthesis